MHRGSAGPLGPRIQVYFFGCVIIFYFWELFVVRPQGCLEVASVGVCALRFY